MECKLYSGKESDAYKHAPRGPMKMNATKKFRWWQYIQCTMRI